MDAVGAREAEHLAGIDPVRILDDARVHAIDVGPEERIAAIVLGEIPERIALADRVGLGRGGLSERPDPGSGSGRAGLLKWNERGIRVSQRRRCRIWRWREPGTVHGPGAQIQRQCWTGSGWRTLTHCVTYLCSHGRRGGEVRPALANGGGSGDIRGRNEKPARPPRSRRHPHHRMATAGAQNGRSSSSASSASGKSSNDSLPLGAAAAAPAATLLGAEYEDSDPSPRPESRISSRAVISVV